MPRYKVSTKLDNLEICGLKVQTIKKDIKNMHLGVYPPQGRIRVAAPLKMTDDSIRLFIVSKIPWIKKQKANFENQQRQTQRDFVTGESHYYLGKRYLLNVKNVNDKPKVKLSNKNKIELYTKKGSSQKINEKIFDDWYRSELKKRLPKLIKKWESIIGVQVNKASIRKMKTKWGSCKDTDGTIILNLELAKKPINCLEYILVHEMVHLLEKTHSDKFNAYMDKLLPNWKSIKAELNEFPLSYNHWSY